MDAHRVNYSMEEIKEWLKLSKNNVTLFGDYSMEEIKEWLKPKGVQHV